MNVSFDVSIQADVRSYHSCSTRQRRLSPASKSAGPAASETQCQRVTVTLAGFAKKTETYLNLESSKFNVESGPGSCDDCQWASLSTVSLVTVAAATSAGPALAQSSNAGCP